MAALSFELPPALEAHEPPEARDGVRLLVGRRAGNRVEHRRFPELAELLEPGDLLVVNVSATLPAAVRAHRADGAPNGGPIRVHFSTRAPGLPDDWWVVELRTADGGRPCPARRGETLSLARGAATLELVAPYASGARLMLGRVAGPGTVEELLERYGEPIRYGHLSHSRPLADYQNVYARVPGSAEMPSAGRPFTQALLRRLGERGVGYAELTLHCGVSSPERHEPPFAEWYEVPESTARQVAQTRAAGGRVIAVGTTVVRALETITGPDGTPEPGAGWSRLVVGPHRRLRAVDGLITGWHEPEASHMLMLEACGGAELIAHCYRQALEQRYLWHEFGDSHLILP